MAEEAKEATEEIARLKIEFHAAIGRINSLEHMVELEKLAMKELGKMIALIEEHATAEKAKAVAETVEASLWTYDLGFDECKALVKRLYPMINIDLLIP